MDTWPVDLWTVSLADPRPAILSTEEGERADRFRFDADRVRWTRARSALRGILARYAGDAPLALRFVYGKHGKPALAPASDIEFNLSHAGDWALIAVSRSAPVGVDIERMRPDVDIAQLLRRLGETGLPAGIPDLFKAWTRREARSKAVGGALFDPPPDAVLAFDVAAPAGYAAALAMLGYEPRIAYRADESPDAG
jgi:4'-phosphopantetheinyl transferase